MKHLLRIQVEGLSLIKNKLDITFYGVQRANETDMNTMYKLCNNIYLNCATAFIGKNASGKTTLLQTISLCLNILNGKSIDNTESNYVLSNSKEVTITMFYTIDNGNTNCVDKDTVYCLETTIQPKITFGEKYYIIVKENLYSYRIGLSTLKKNLTDISKYKLIKERKQNEEYLQDDVSIVISQNKEANSKDIISSLIALNSFDKLIISNDITSLEIINFLDSSIEKLYFENINIDINNTNNNSSPLIHLKFKNRNDEIVIHDFKDLELYLSSGTIKGITTFTLAMEILKKGGYLLIDEIENHFNKEIVSTLIRMFMDSKFNINGSVLIYSTHYPELLDEYERNDSIYITENKDGITATNLYQILKRNDIKKSDAYQSNLIADTQPKYEDYIKMKNKIFSYIKGE